MGKIVAKTIRFRACGVMEEFVNMQRNFSGAVRYLILEYIGRQKEEGLPIEDLSSKLEEAKIVSMVDSIMEKRGRPKVDNSSTLRPEKVLETVSLTLNHRQESSHDIPECYS